MTTAKALVVDDVDGQIVSAVKELPLADIGSGDVLIKVHYSGINYKDMLAITGAGKIMKTFPCVAGIDAAGEVVESADSRWPVGALVAVIGCGIGESHDGGLGEYLRVPGDWVLDVPASMGTHAAAAIGTAGFTAGLSIHRMQHNGLVTGNGPVAITGATGGVGSIATDMLSSIGHEVHAITGKAEASDYLLDIGASKIITRETIDLPGKPLSDGMWAGAIDNLGGQMLSWLTRTAKPWAPVVSVGLAASPKLDTFVFPFILRGVSLLGASSTNCPMQLKRDVWAKIAEEYKPQRLDRIVARTVSLDELDVALKDMHTGRTVGRTVVKL